MSSSGSDTIVCPTCKESIPSDYVVCPYDGTSLISEIKEKTKVKIRFRESFSRVFRLAFRPDKTMKVVQEFVTNPDKKGVYIVLYLASALYAMTFASYLFAAEPGFDIVFILFFYLVFGIIAGLIIFIFVFIFYWLISFFYHQLAKSMGGDAAGTRAESQGVVGYAIAPFITILLILNIVLLFTAPTADTGVAGIVDIGNPPSGGIISDNIAYGWNYNSDADFDMAKNIVFYLTILGCLWSLALGTILTQKIHNIPRLQSVILNGIFIISFLWIAYLV